MTFLRWIILGLLFYLLYRLIRGSGRKNESRISKRKTKQESDPFKEADIQDVPYVELPPEKKKDENSTKGT